MKKTYNLILEVELKKEITEGIFDNFIDNKLIATETWLNENSDGMKFEFTKINLEDD